MSKPGSPMAAPMTWGAGAAEWDTSLLACCDNLGICCKGLFCPCVLYGDNVEHITGKPSDVACCEYCMCVCLLPLPCTACCLAKGKRKDLRRKYGLKGGSDCMAHACCSCCALCQEAREISFRAPGMEAAERMASGTSNNNNSNPGSPHGAYTAPQPQTFIQLPAAHQVAQVPNLPGHQIVQLPSGHLAYVPIVMQQQPMAPTSCGGSGVSRSSSRGGGGGGGGSGTYPPPPGHQKNPYSPAQ